MKKVLLGVVFLLHLIMLVCSVYPTTALAAVDYFFHIC